MVVHGVMAQRAGLSIDCAAELAFHEGRHDSPGLIRGALDLRGIRSSDRKVPPEPTFTIKTVAILAVRQSRRLPIPIRFSGNGIACGLSRGGLREWQH
jgi:hypothetical protein